MSVSVLVQDYMEDDEVFVYSNPEAFKDMDIQIGRYLFEGVSVDRAKSLRKQLKHAIARIEEKHGRS